MDNNFVQRMREGVGYQAPQPQYPSAPRDISETVNAMPNADKLSGAEKWIYQKLPGFSQSSVGKALQAFSESPAGKALQVLDVGAEALERTFGLFAQYMDKDPNEDINLKDAWSAGSLFWDSVNLPRIKWNNGLPTGIQMDTDLPGVYALTEARRLLGEGATMDEVKDKYYKNLGALALRSQLNDTWGHVIADPLNWLLGAVKPVEKLHAIRNLALTGKVDVEVVQALEEFACVVGNIEDATKYAEFLAKAEKDGKAMTKFDKFAIMLTGGTPYTQDVTKMTKTQQWLSKLNPFALTPQARASEMLDMVAANVGEYLIRPNWGADPEEFVNAMGRIARGSIGGEYGHFAATVQGRTVQAFISQSEAAAKVGLQEWKAFSKERSLLSYLSDVFGSNEIALKKLAGENPEAFMQKISKYTLENGDQTLMKELQNGGITIDSIKSASQVEDYALVPEAFYAKILVDIQDTAMKQAIVQFGIKEKGLITKWSDALKAWESLPFIKANPANMVRNVVNNEITLIGRGLFGTMTGSAIEKFWEGKWMPPQFMRSFGFGAEEIKSAEKLQFEVVDKAAERLTQVLTGDKLTLADKLKIKAGKTSLGPLDAISEYSQKAEQMASRRASTMGWLEFHQKYWNPTTGFTSVTKHLDPAVIDKIEEVAPGLSNILDDIAQEAGADSAKFQKLMDMGLEGNSTTVLKAAEDTLGYKFDDVMSPDVMQVIKDGLPEAMKNGTVNSFMDGVRTQMEQHVDDMFNRHVENLPGIIAAQVQAGGPMQYHRIFGKSMDEFWAGNLEHSMRMSTLNDVMDYAKATGNYEKVGKIWEKILGDGENHFNRVWKKFDAYQEGLKAGAKNAGIAYPEEVTRAFGDMKKGWQDFFEYRNTEYKKFFGERLKGEQHVKQLEQIQTTLDTMYKKLIEKEDSSFQHIDDLMSKSLDPEQGKMYMNYRDAVSNLRIQDRQKTTEFFSSLRKMNKEQVREAYSKFWQEKMGRIEEIRSMEARGSAAIQGDVESAKLFQGQPTKQIADPQNIFELASNYGVPTASPNGARMDKRLLATINKYLPEGQTKFSTLNDVPMDVAKQALEARALQSAESVTSQARQFIPDAEKIFQDPMPIETGISELNYGKTYAMMDAIAEEATNQSGKSSKLLKDLPEDVQKSVKQWMNRVDEEMSGFRSAGVQYAAFRRDSALLNYNRRTNFDNLVGHMAPFAFWTTHSVANWAIYSLDRPAMLANYFRVRKFFETAGLPGQNVPSRMRGHIRVQLPFTPDWMGDTFVNPMRFMLPFDGFMQPWENAQSSKFRVESKTKQTLETMLEGGEITQEQFDSAMQNQSGEAWDIANGRATEGGENYDAMDFVSMTMTPHAPLMWAYNAATGQKNDIGPFTPMSKTIRNFATMAGVEDWSNSPYNVEGRIRKMMGLPAYDKWDDYRVGREISNMAADGKYSMEAIQDAMEVAALVESGQMTSEEAVKSNKVYKDATYRANQESAGGWAGTIAGLLGIPLKSYPTGEQKQRELGEQFSAAYEKYNNGDVKALSDFFNDHPEYESRLALFKKPEERLKTFMVDNVWQRWNELPKVNQDEIRDQLGDNFANNFLSSETRNYDAINPMQLQIWLKLMGGKQVGRLDASVEAMAEFNQLKLTDPQTAFRVQTFYDGRNTQSPNWFKLQSKYYDLPENQRKAFLKDNPELKGYWDYRRKWMESNPDLVRYLTDDPKQLAKYEKMQRQPEVSVPTANEIKQYMSEPMMELISDGQSLPYSMNQYLDALSGQYGLTKAQLLSILTGKSQ